MDVRQVMVLYCHLEFSGGLLISVDISAFIGVSVWCFYILFCIINKCVRNIRLSHYLYLSSYEYINSHSYY